LLLEGRSPCFARTREFCIQQDRIAEGGNSLSLVKPPPKKPKSASLQVRIDADIRQKLDLYAEFIESTPSYVVAEALKLLFNRDGEFKHWLGQHANSSLVSESNPELKGEESLVDPFKLAWIPAMSNSIRARTQTRQEYMACVSQLAVRRM